LFLMSLSLLNTNSAVSGQQQLCELNINCSSCLAQSGCGWCAKTGVCLASSNGAEACEFLSGTWTTSAPSCPVETCANTYPSYLNCSACKLAAGCGWCNLPGLGGLCRQSGFQGFCGSASGAWNPKTCPTVAETCYINNTDCTNCHEYTTESCGWCTVSETQGVCLRGSDGATLCEVLSSAWTGHSTACPASTTGVHHAAATTAVHAATTGVHAKATTGVHEKATTAVHSDATTAVHSKGTTAAAIGNVSTTASSESTTASSSAVTTHQTHTVDDTDVIGGTTGHISSKQNATVFSSGMRTIGAATLVSSIAIALTASWY